MAGDEELLAGVGPLEPVAEAVAEVVGADGGLGVGGGRMNGADGTRTHDPLRATQVLSQLSYSPSELMIGCECIAAFW